MENPVCSSQDPTVTPKEPSQKKEKWFSLKQKAALVLCVNAFAVLSVLFFAPIEVYLGNIIEFSFPFDNVWWILLLCSVLIILVTGAIECLLPDKLFLVINLGAFALGLCCYVQAMFLNGQMGTLTGENKVYSNGLVLINLLIWLLTAAAVCVPAAVLLKKKKRKVIPTVIKFTSLALVAMQAVALVSLLLSTDTSSFEKNDYLVTDGQFELSDKKNVVVFILDTCDMVYVNAAMEQYPDLMQGLHGFTHYPNAISTHSRTFPSIPYLLTGEKCYLDIPYNDYINKAYESSRFLPDIYEAGGDIRLFTENAYIGAPIKSKISNSSAVKRGDLSAISIPSMLKQMVKISLYRELPYAVKPRFQYEVSAINGAVVNLQEAYVSESDALFYSQLKEQGMTVDTDFESAFRFYHFNGAHYGYNIDQYGIKVDQTDMASAIKGDFHIIEDYIQRMQQLGIYEDSTIIITADHGISVATDVKALQIEESRCPLLLVKEAGKGMDDPFRVSNAPVGHADLFPTILAAYGLDYSEYGQPIYEISEDEQRERYYYFTAFVSDEDGEIALREYQITGDAQDFANWQLTGKYWDIKYSQHSVSKNRLADTLKQAENK